MMGLELSNITVLVAVYASGTSARLYTYTSVLIRHGGVYSVYGRVFC